jgi:biotin carboxyl carrier protein
VKVRVLIGGVAYEVEVEDSTEGKPSTSSVPMLPGAANPQSSVLPTTGAGGSASEVEANPKVCRSSIAGIVVRVMVQPGQELEVHDLMLVLEAMKMETNVTAPSSGKLKCVNVAPGDAVKVDQILLEFE